MSKVKKQNLILWTVDIFKHPLYFLLNNVTKKDGEELDRLYYRIKEKGVDPWDHNDEDVRAYHAHAEKLRYSPWSYLIR